MSVPIVVFDLDGTLVDTAPDLLGTLAVVLSEFGYPAIGSPNERAIIGQGSRRMIDFALDALGADAATADLEAMHLRFLDHYGENVAVRSQPFPAVPETLDRLAAAGATLAICTNKYEAMSVKLMDALGLTDRFAAIVGADTLPMRKPDPGHLTGTIERAGGDPARAVMIGDSRTDIDTAKAAGIPVIAVDFGYTDVPVGELGPDHVISHYDELYDLAVRHIGLE